MEMVFAIGISILSLALVVLITLQPRQQQSLSTDATSNLGKPSYWRSHRELKLATYRLSRILISLYDGRTGLVFNRMDKKKLVFSNFF